MGVAAVVAAAVGVVAAAVADRSSPPRMYPIARQQCGVP